MLITLPFRGAAGFGDPFSETPGRPLARVFGRRVAASAVAFRDVTRRKETICLAVLRCAGAMKINITFSKREGGREREEELIR